MKTRRLIPVLNVRNPWLYLSVSILGMALWAVVFFSTGYEHNEEPGKQFIGYSDTDLIAGSTAQSPECTAKQKKAAKFAAPLEKENNRLAHILIYSPLPLENGAIMHDKSQALESKINDIYIKYQCR